MVDFLEYSDISSEVKGTMCPGRLKLTDQHIIFKNSKTGKVDQLTASDLELVNWQKLVDSWGLRLFLKSGSLHRFSGFKDADREKLSKFFNLNYKQEMLEKELSLKGWNWGTARFNGSVLSFDVGSNTSFEVPLNHVSQCTTGKNEVTLEFHQNDDSAVSLMEMRFHIPSSELAGDVDPVDAFHQQVMKQASVISLSGDAITTFKEIQCLTPRGRYDVKVYPSFFQLHGKTFDYKIPMSTVLRLFLLPHKDGRQTFFVASLDPPIKQGQTRYHFLVFLFGPEEETSVEISLTEEELRDKYDNKLSKEMTGHTYDVMGRVMKAIIGRKITTPGSFVGHTLTPAVSCSYKAAAGYLYPLERGFIYVHKPPVHIRFEEITSVNFARSGGGTRSFDFEVEIKSGVVHTFSSIEKDEYEKLFDFINTKKLRVKNRGKNDKTSFTDDFGNSDQEDEPDAYLARVKAEAEERDDGDGEDSESTDEDFNPDQPVSEVSEDDSNPADTESDASGGSATEKKKEKKHKKSKTVSEKPRKRREKKVDDGRPKRPSTAFMIWLGATRDKIKADHPGISVTEIAKKAGEMWKAMSDKSEWEAKAVKAKEEYAVKMKEFEASGGSVSAPKSGSAKPKKPRVKTEKKESERKSTSSAKNTSGSAETSQYKSKEYISDDDTTSSDESDKNTKKAPVKAPTKNEKSKPSTVDKMEVYKSSGSESDAKEKKKPAKPSKVDKKPVKKESSDEKMSVDDSESEKDSKKKKKPELKKSRGNKKETPKKKKKQSSESEESNKASSDSEAEKNKSKKKPEPKKDVKGKGSKAKKDSDEEESAEETPASSDEDSNSGSD